MEAIKRVMLAVALPRITDAKLPGLASKKIDGVRATVVNGKLVSRTMKPIPNWYIQRMLGMDCFEGLDGELVVGPPNDANCMQTTMSGVMSREGTPDFHWYVFDDWSADGPYAARAAIAKARSADAQPWVSWLPHKLVRSVEALEAFEAQALEEGYEGAMLRDPRGPYKQNRATLKEGYLVKIKRFMDGEAEVLDTMEQMRNDNEATFDERGFTKRTTHKANKAAAGILGALHVKDIRTGVEFDVGAGFTLEQRTNLWAGRKYLIGKLIKYKHFAVGVVDKPRFPIFLGFRDKRDM